MMDMNTKIWLDKIEKEWLKDKLNYLKKCMDNPITNSIGDIHHLSNEKSDHNLESIITGIGNWLILEADIYLKEMMDKYINDGDKSDDVITPQYNNIEKGN